MPIPLRDADPFKAADLAACHAVDRGGAGDGALDRLPDRLDRTCAGRPPPVPSDRAFADVVARHGIPRTWRPDRRFALAIAPFDRLERRDGLGGNEAP